jgi:hypothetical protein
MAQHLRIRCIVKTGQTSAYERIHAIGGVNPNGSGWKLTQDKAISQVENGTSVFYIERPGGQRVDAIIAMDAHANKYLKTVADRDQPDNLLYLPTCP